MAKRTRKSKAANVEKKKDLGPPECFVCKTPRPGGHAQPLASHWMCHVRDDETYAKGYWMPLTCSDECRNKGGFKIWRA